MKRTLFFILLLSVFLFTSCELLTYLLLGDQPEDYEEGYTTVKCEPDAKIYLVKLNTTSQKIGASYTGKVTGTSRSVSDNFEESFADTDSFIRSMIYTLNTTPIDNSREVANTSSIKKGYNEDITFTKDGTYPFWTFVKKGSTTNSGIPGEVNGVCKYVGKHCYIFADSKDSNSSIINLNDKDYENLAKKFDDCYELEVSVIGNPLYQEYDSRFFVPCNKKIVILVSDLFGDAKEKQENEGGTVGYFYPADLWNKEYLKNTKGYNYGVSEDSSRYIRTNELEIFYIDSYFLSRMPKTVYSTLVHEFNHMINYVVKTINQNPNGPQSRCSTWFTEMLAMVTEDMFQDYLEIDDLSSPKGRLPYFNNFYYYGFKNWDDNNIEPQYMYANTYGFGAFLARNFGGIDLIKEIAQNPYVDEKAITTALKARGINKSFNDVLQKFSSCLFHITDAEDNTVYTFNKSAGTKADVLYFDAIDINKIKINDNYYPPKYFKYNEQVDLYPYGFSVHYVGENISSFKLAGNKGESILYYMITAYND